MKQSAVRALLVAALAALCAPLAAPPATGASYVGPCERAMFISYYQTYWISYENYLPIGNGDYQTNCYMRPGYRGDDVKALQLALNRCYGSVIGSQLVVDGSFGPLTEAALRRVQSRLRITVDGHYGNETRAAMAWPVYANPYRVGGPRTYDNRCN